MEEAVVPVLYTDDADRAIAWYGRLGFHKEWEVQFEPGFPRFVSVARGRVRLYLSEHKGDARPDTLIHLYVNDIDAVSEEFGVPVDYEGLPGRESALVDPDGNRLRVATAGSEAADQGPTRIIPSTGPGGATPNMTRSQPCVSRPRELAGAASSRSIGPSRVRFSG